jgi:hypothetical protein
MFRILAVVIFAIGLAACDAVNTVTEGAKQARAVESDLAESTGIRPQVGFNWRNGRLVSVTVAFPRIHDTKSLRELAAAVRTAIDKEFKQTPDNIVLAFSLGKTEPGTKVEGPAEHRVTELAGL